MGFKKVTTKKGAWHKEAVVETPLEPDSTVKGRIRLRIDSEVGNVYKLIADANDMISLLMSMNSFLYSELLKTMSPEQIAAMNQEKKALIDYATSKFGNTITTADIDFSIDAFNKIDSLIGNQGKVGEIVIQEKKL